MENSKIYTSSSGSRFWYYDDYANMFSPYTYTKMQIDNIVLKLILHRIDGPAIEFYTHSNNQVIQNSDGWYMYIMGERYTPEQYWLKIALMKANGEI